MRRCQLVKPQYLQVSSRVTLYARWHPQGLKVSSPTSHGALEPLDKNAISVSLGNSICLAVRRPHSPAQSAALAAASPFLQLGARGVYLILDSAFPESNPVLRRLPPWPPIRNRSPRLQAQVGQVRVISSMETTFYKLLFPCSLWCTPITSLTTVLWIQFQEGQRVAPH